DARMHRERIECVVGGDRDGRVGLPCRKCRVGVFEREAREQLVCGGEARLDRERLARPLDRSSVEAVGAYACEREIGRSVSRVARERLVEKIYRVRVIESLVKQEPPSDPIDGARTWRAGRQSCRLRVGRRHRGTEIAVRRLVIVEPPLPLRAPICPRGRRRALSLQDEFLVARVRLGPPTALLKRYAALRRGRRRRGRRSGSRRERRSKRLGERDEHRNGPDAHWSSASCTFASSTRASVISRLY